MMDRSPSSSSKNRLAVGAIAAALMLTGAAGAQVTGSSQTTTDAQGQATQSATAAMQSPTTKKQRVSKDEKVKSTKDTVAAAKKEKKLNPLVGKDADLPDKQLYDKAITQIKAGHFDVARLDLNTLLSTYPDSQYQMRAKLAIADAWYREGGSAALAQAEQEYKDFITFFPNAPEAAEAQMRVGDIYFKQMDVPDRDDKNAVHAEEEYRTMLKQYPDAPKEVLTQAQQKLRDVQEVLAQAEADKGTFYASHEDWPAALARYETVHQTYPQYSHMDDVLIGEGDAYEAEAKIARNAVVCAAGLPPGTQCLPEAAKSALEQEYDKKAADEYREVVLKHSAAAHSEFAKERLAEMNLPIPEPTAEDAAASDAMEGSRAQYTMQKRLELLVMRKPDTVTAAQVGDPTLEDPAPVLAPEVAHAILDSYRVALTPGGANAAVKTATPATEPAPGEGSPQPSSAPTAPAPPTVAAAPALSDVPAAGSSNNDGAATEMSPTSPSGASPSGTGLGVEVLTPVNTGSGAASSLNSATGAADPNLGLKTVAPKDTSALPAVEQPAPAPDQVNDVAGTTQPPAQTKDPNQKKNPKPSYDKNDESSSTHKDKKGLDKLNPF